MLYFPNSLCYFTRATPNGNPYGTGIWLIHYTNNSIRSLTVHAFTQYFVGGFTPSIIAAFIGNRTQVIGRGECFIVISKVLIYLIIKINYIKKVLFIGNIGECSG